MLTLVSPPISEARTLVCGRVEHGDQRGRLLGFPTANIGLRTDCLAPPDGVFGGFVHRADGRCYEAAISIGRRPTFYQNRGLHLIEAHLINFNEDLYEEVLVVELAVKIRDQERFANAPELQAQLRRDVRACSSMLENRSPIHAFIPTI